MFNIQLSNPFFARRNKQSGDIELGFTTSGGLETRVRLGFNSEYLAFWYGEKQADGSIVFDSTKYDDKGQGFPVSAGIHSIDASRVRLITLKMETIVEEAKLAGKPNLELEQRLAELDGRKVALVEVTTT